MNNRDFRPIDKTKIVFALSSGVLLTGSFPKTGRGWLAWFALVPLFIALRNVSVKHAFRLGLMSGLAHYLTLLYWLAYTMNRYGNIPLVLGIVILFLFAAYLALYTGAFAAIVVRFSPTPSVSVVMIPLVWVSLEYIRTFLFSGFPWELVGYAQFNRLLLIQIADIFGVYGVSFLVLLSNGIIFLVFLYLSKKDWKGKPATKRGASAFMLAVVLIFGLAVGYGKWRIQTIDRRISESPSSRIAVVQGNIAQSAKWDLEFQVPTIKKYAKLSLSAKTKHPDLVVWPETATPFYFLRNRPLSKMVTQAINDMGTDFLIGSPYFAPKNRDVEYYNSAYLIGPKGMVYGRYDKAHLVPFGEYIPFHDWLPFLNKIVEGVGDFKPGERGKTLPWGNHRLGVQICYEIIFPDLSRAMVKNDAVLLINITNDAWYGRSSAPYQHFSMTVFRAVENRRSLVRSANTGISGFIDPAGRTIAATPIFIDAVLTRSVPMIKETSFYTRHGDLFALLCLALALIIALIYHFRSK